MKYSQVNMPIKFSHSTEREVVQVEAEEMGLAISQQTLDKLLASGVLNASEIRPLTSKTKATIQKLCLQGCQGRSCNQCIFQKKCEFS